MNYVILLRGINVGGYRKVNMAELKKQLSEVAFEKVKTYINSGNLLLSSKLSHEETLELLAATFKKHYDFDLLFVALTFEEFQAEYQSLPEWWFDEGSYRRNVLFYMPSFKPEDLLFEGDLHERIYLSKVAIYWLVKDATYFTRSQYQKLARSPVYQRVTIRNANTFKKLYELTLEF